jgi:hypothetical protein
VLLLAFWVVSDGHSVPDLNFINFLVFYLVLSFRVQPILSSEWSAHRPDRRGVTAQTATAPAETDSAPLTAIHAAAQRKGAFLVAHLTVVLVVLVELHLKHVLK